MLTLGSAGLGFCIVLRHASRASLTLSWVFQSREICMYSTLRVLFVPVYIVPVLYPKYDSYQSIALSAVHRAESASQSTQWNRVPE